MRFRRWPKVTPYQDTTRKRAGIVRSKQRARERLPLLAPLIAEEQESVDAVVAVRATHAIARQQAERDSRSDRWRQARKNLGGRDRETRLLLRALWRECPYPADPSYLLGLLHDVDAGRIDPLRPPWKFPDAPAPRVSKNPRTFAEAFRQIGRRKVGGGPKTTAADEFTFCGNLGSGIVFLVSRVRLIEPNESFYTSAPHRLRDSYVGRSGHWMDLEVGGECSDAELEKIRELAQAADARPVRIRRHGMAHIPGPPEKKARRLLILACSGRKRGDEGRIPARERYDGPLWQTLRTVDPNGHLAEVAFVSARLGFRCAATEIEDYDARLTPELARRMIEGGMATRWPRPPSPDRPDNFGIHPGHEIASMARYGEAPFTEVALAGGGLYRTVMRAFVEGFRAMGCVTTEACVVEINGPIGRMRQELRAWLTAEPDQRLQPDPGPRP
jgi:hypothetical protein